MAYDPKLGRLFFFSEDDLAANRQGRLSPEQARGFATTAEVGRRSSRRTLPVFFVLLAAVVVVAVVTSASSTGTSAGDTWGPIALVAGMGAFLCFLVWFFRRRTARSQAVQHEGVVLAVQGRFDYDPTWDNTFGIDIGGVRFLVELLQYQALDDQAEYRAYFLNTDPHATLLSIETSPAISPRS